jgi:hypothetical protein
MAINILNSKLKLPSYRCDGIKSHLKIFAMSYDRLAESISKLSEHICENEKFEKFASGVAPTVAGAVASVVTGNPLVGKAAAAVTGGLSRSESKAVAETVVTTGIIVVSAAVSVVAFPLILGAAIFTLFRSDS